jgi:hypothetical protein
MARFDPEVWVDRARARFTRERAAKRPGAASRFERDKVSINKINELIKWCTSKKITVTFDNEEVGEYADKKIRCNVHARPDIQLYMLLHECGHFLIGVEHEKFVLSTSDINDPSIRRTTTTYRLDVLGEEMEAWHRGWKLANRLKIKIDRNAYLNLRTKMMKTHLMWVMDPKCFEKQRGED